MTKKINPIHDFKFATEQQELVLKASLLEKNKAIYAWEKWKSTTNLEGYHNDVFRLLPLLYHNLIKHKVEHPFMKRLKGVYKMFWYQNKQLLHENTKILNELQQSGIDTLLLKGAPLAILHYRNIALRPMNDIDVLVKKNDVEKSINFFIESGWTPQLLQIKDHLKYRHSVGFLDNYGNEFDIHWHPLVESIWEENHNDFWENSDEIIINNHKTRAFCPTDLLLHTIIHGIRWNPEPNVRWIADSFYLINYSGNRIDWKRFIYLTKKYNLALKIKQGLRYLSEIFDAKIPSSVLNKLEGINISRIDKIEYDYILNDPEETHSQKFVGNLLYNIISYRNITGKKPRLKHIIMYPDYLRYKYNAPNLFSLVILFITLFFKKSFMNLVSVFSGKTGFIKNKVNE